MCAAFLVLQAVTAFSRALAGAVAYSEERKAEMTADLDESKTAMFSKLAVGTLCHKVTSLHHALLDKVVVGADANSAVLQ